MDNTTFTIDDCGLLIGLVSMPKVKKDNNQTEEQNIKKFYSQEIKDNLSKKYKEQRITNFIPEHNKIDKELYSPLSFRIFSDYDIAVLTLIDDLSYPNRVFNPSHGCRGENDEYYNYDYQVITCFNSFQEGSNKLRLKQMFLDQIKQKYPYICITKAKLNNIFLVGNGMDFTEPVKNTIMAMSEQYNQKQNIIKTYTFDSLGSEEIIIINFARNLSSIAQLLQETRCLIIKNLKKGNSENTATHLREKAEKDYGNKEWEKSHVFCSVYSLAGYSFDLSTNFSDYTFVPENTENDLEIVFDWDIKAGHPKACRKDFNEKIQRLIHEKYKPKPDSLKIEYNSGNYILRMSEIAGWGVVPSADFFTIIEELREMDLARENIRKLHISMNIGFKDVATSHLFLNKIIPPEDDFIPDQHPSNSVIGEKLRISDPELSKLREGLAKSKMSKMLRERVMKMYNNYNHSINDPLFVGSFIDFHGFMKTLIASIKLYSTEIDSKISSEQFQTWVTECVDGFEQAYYNRFHQSDRMRNMTDFNLEWNGCLQQVISPLDNVVKELLSNTGYRFYDKFLYISGLHGANVKQNMFRIRANAS